jgi:site-specific recombinase XerD
MHDLIPIDATPPGTLTEAEIDATMAFAKAQHSPATRRCYASDWTDFAAWCAERGASALPAHQRLVAAYLSWLAQSGRKASTIGRRAAAIAHRHKLAGHEPPTNGEGVKATLRGIRRTIGTAPDQKAAITANTLRSMLDLCPNTLRGHRDRALLALGFAGAFRRSELCNLQLSDLSETPDGLMIRIRHSKTDQEGQGQEIAIPRGARLRPVEAVQTWLDAAKITDGPLFRAVIWENGTMVARDGPLGAENVAAVVKSYAKRAGLNPNTFAGHSLRSGLITSCVEEGASPVRIAEHSRHRSLDMILVYTRRANLFVDHAAAKVL